jgi:hypothetical protein
MAPDPRPPARRRIPPVNREPERPGEPQEGTSLTPTVDVTYSGADGRRYGKGGALPVFPEELARRLGLGNFPPQDRWRDAEQLLADPRPGIQAKRAAKVADWLNTTAMPDAQWDAVHELIEERHPCLTRKHETCGCQVHQGWCPCLPIGAGQV